MDIEKNRENLDEKVNDIINEFKQVDFEIKSKLQNNENTSNMSLHLYKLKLKKLSKKIITVYGNLYKIQYVGDFHRKLFKNNDYNFNNYDIKYIKRLSFYNFISNYYIILINRDLDFLSTYCDYVLFEFNNIYNMNKN